MKKILILSGQMNRQENIHRMPRELMKGLKSYSRSAVTWSHFKHLQFSIVHNQLIVRDALSKQDISDFDLVYFRTWAKHFSAEAFCAALYLQQQHVAFIDQEPLYGQAHGKLAEYCLLAVNAIPVPDTLFARRLSILQQLITAHHFTYPLILKDATSSKGKNNYLVHTKTQLAAIVRRKRHCRFVVQRYVSNDYDFRLLVLGDKVGTLSKRVRRTKHDHRNNASRGAREEEIAVNTFDPRILKDAITSAQLLRRQVAGVDVIIDRVTGQHYILEVNYAPELTYDAAILSEVPQLSDYLDRVVRQS